MSDTKGVIDSVKLCKPKSKGYKYLLPGCTSAQRFDIVSNQKDSIGSGYRLPISYVQTKRAQGLCYQIYLISFTEIC